MNIKNFLYSYTNSPSIQHCSDTQYPHVESISSSSTSFSFEGSDFKLNSEQDILEDILFDCSSDQSNLIPPGLKYLYKNMLVYERPPTHKMISCYSEYLDQIKDNSKLYSFYIPIPWQLYIVEFDDNMRTYGVRMYFMNTPLLSEDQHLYLPYIPNFYSNGKLCRPFFSSSDDINRYSQTVSGVIESSYDWVWSSNFNLDLTETISAMYSQKTPIEISRLKTGIEHTYFRIPFSTVFETYKLIETFSLSDVSSFVYPNPSLAQSHNHDNESMNDTYDLFIRYCDEFGLYCDDESESDYFYEEVVGSEDFNSWIPKSEKIPKKYSEIKNFILNENNSLFQNKSLFLNSLIRYSISSSISQIA